MKTSTLVSFLTLSLVSTNAVASVLPPTTSPDGPSSVSSPVLHRRDAHDISEPVIEEELTQRPPTLRRNRFRKRGSEGHATRQVSSLDPGRGRIGPDSNAKSSSSTPDSNLGHSPVVALQRRGIVRKQVPDIAPEAIANSALQRVDMPGILSKTDPNAMSSSVLDTHPRHLASAAEADQDDTLAHFLLHRSSEATPTKRDDNEDLIDIKYLNYALVIEQLLYAHYLQGLRRFSEADFQNAGFPAWVRGRFREMAEHERTHKEFLESAIVAAGSDHVQPANYDFQDQDIHSFIDTSMALESIAASGYIGVLQFFNNKAYVTAEAAMLADRARQAGWINSAVRKQNPWNTAFETPLTPQQVFTLLSVFVNDETSPKANKALLPVGLLSQTFPRLTLSPRLVPGEQAEISFPYAEATDGRRDFLFVAFMSGVETILGRVLDREERNEDEILIRRFVEIPRDLESRGVVYVVVLRGNSEAVGDVRMDDESVVAGPAISTFPFDAGGKSI